MTRLPHDPSAENEPEENQKPQGEPDGDGSDDYEVGYGRPPKDTRFKRGTSGNPEGLRKRPLSVGEQLKQILNQRINVTEGGRSKKLSRQTVMLTTLANKAAKADIPALRVTLDLLRTHDDAKGSTIQPLLLEEDSVKLIELYLQQQTLGEEIVNDELSAPGEVAPDQTPPTNDNSSEGLS